MATRTAIIKAITDNPPKKDGSKSISLVFEDDIFGVFGYKNDHGLKSGSGILYVYTEKTSKKGALYHDISSIIIDPSIRTEAPKEKPKSNVFLDVAMKEEVRKEKYKASVEAMKMSVDVYSEGNIDSEKTLELFRTVKNALFDTIHEIASE